MARKRTRRTMRPLTNPLLVALDHATTLTPAELAQITTPLRAAHQRLRGGSGSCDDWCVLAGSLGVAQNIERQGVVRGLAGHLQAADTAMAAIEARATAHAPQPAWAAPALHFHEIEALDVFVDVHLFQLRQLSYAEFRRAYLATEGQVRSRGGQAQRLAA